MEQGIPGHLTILIVTFQVLTPPLIIGGAWLALRRSSLSEAERFPTWAVMTTVFLAWFIVALTLSRSGAFIRTSEQDPVLQFALVTPIVVGLVLLLGTARGRSLVAAAPQSWIIAVQIYRALGAIFLILWARDSLPGEFAIPAGAGDIIVGASAPVVAWLNARGSPYARGLTRAWNIFGILDLVVAVTTGFLTAPSTMQMLAFDRPNLLITAYPLVMVPVFLVPLSIILHGLSLWKLGQAADTAKRPAQP